MKPILCKLIFFALVFGGVVHRLPLADAQQAAVPYVILKLDDLRQISGPEGPVGSRWQRTADFLAQNRIKASFGIIGSSLEHDNRLYFDWITSRRQSGLVEFWLHGYRERSNTERVGEFDQGSANEQAAPLRRTEDLAKQKLSFPLAAFGPHWSQTTPETEKAVESIPEVKIWLYGPTASTVYHGLSLPRYLTLEDPIFDPDFDHFKALYEKAGKGKRVLVLQGHPDTWKDEAKWLGFVRIVHFLQEQGCIFVTPSEYLVLHSSGVL